MNTEIVRASGISGGISGSGRRTQLPQDFPVLVESATREIIEPVLFFLIDRYQRSPNTAKSAANDLKDWWAYLAEFKKRWDTVDREDVEAYRDAMLQTVSPQTHRPYADSTVLKRVGTVLNFYGWARSKGLVEEDIDMIVVAPSYRAIDTDSLAHIHNNKTHKVSEILPKRRTGIDDYVTALTAHDVSLVFRALGPLPSEQQVDPRPARDRLIGELSLNTGMRRDEVKSLTKWQVLNLKTDPNKSRSSVCALPLTKTKGLRPRKVLVPVWLVDELIRYYETERAEAIKHNHPKNAARKSADPLEFFVNGTSSRHNAGKPISNDSINRQFRKAVMDAGLTKTVTLLDPVTKEHYVVQDALYTFHALRHTFAIWRYYAEFKNGSLEPWKIVQALLGHANLHTTMAIYLRPCAAFEGQVSDTVYRYFEDIRNG